MPIPSNGRSFEPKYNHHPLIGIPDVIPYLLQKSWDLLKLRRASKTTHHNPKAIAFKIHANNPSRGHLTSVRNANPKMFVLVIFNAWVTIARRKSPRKSRSSFPQSHQNSIQKDGRVLRSERRSEL